MAEKENPVCWRCKESVKVLFSTRNPDGSMTSVAVCESCFPIVAGETLRKEK